MSSKQSRLFGWSSRSKRRRSRQRPRRANLRPVLESLEDRRLLSNTGSTGSGSVIDNMQPSVAINYIINVSGGTFPDTNGAGDTFLGEVRQFAGTFAPGGWRFADGQVLSIASFSALFSLLGTTYGGDGNTTFGLPDLRGRTPVHVGAGVSLGTSFGADDINLTEAQLPAHTHTIPGGTTGSAGSGQQVDNRAA